MLLISAYHFRKIREKEVSKIHTQLCVAIFFMLLFFLAGIERTENNIACTTCSLLIQYFTMASVAWMGAEAWFMYRKLITVFRQTNLKLISIIAWGTQCTQSKRILCVYIILQSQVRLVLLIYSILGREIMCGAVLCACSDLVHFRFGASPILYM